MVAAVVLRGVAAFEAGGAAGEERRVAVAAGGVEAVEVDARAGEALGEGHLAAAEHVDGEMRGGLEGGETLRTAGGGPEHEGRVERDAGEAVGGHAERALGGHRGHDGHAGGEAPQRTAQSGFVEIRHRPALCPCSSHGR